MLKQLGLKACAFNKSAFLCLPLHLQARCTL